jgi:hypothetical protein
LGRRDLTSIQCSRSQSHVTGCVGAGVETRVEEVRPIFYASDRYRTVCEPPPAEGLVVRRQLLVLSTLWFCLAGFAAGQVETSIRVTGQRINLRAKPSMQSEVVGQVADGDMLNAKSFQGDWVEVTPPETVDLWVHREFLKDNTVTAVKLYVRAGPGINFSVVGTLGRDATITPRGDFGDWIKVVPPPACSLWVSRAYVQVLEPEKAKAEVAAPLPVAQVANPAPAPGAETTAATQAGEQAPHPQGQPPSGQRAETAPPTLPPPSGLNLLSVEGQGRSVQREGVLKLAGLVIGRPSRFRLVRYNGNRVEPLCYVRGNNNQLNSLLGQHMIIRGREYWVEGVRQPVLIPEQIVPQSSQ